MMDISQSTTRATLIQRIKTALPNVLAIYVFGSHVSGHATAESDLDLAVLLSGSGDPVKLWSIAEELALWLSSDVDLIDLRQASTVMQYQIIMTGQRLWQADSQAALYETFILSENTDFNQARAGILADIQTRGTVYDHQ